MPARSLFRLVAADPPTREDFLSYFELGLTPPHASPRSVDLHKGVSMFETADQAREIDARTRHYGHIAEVAIPEGARVERQGRRAGHHNVYATAEELLRWVVQVVPVR